MSDDRELKEFEAWLGTRKAAGAAIDIETCELGRWPACDFDPYGYRQEAGTLLKAEMQWGTNRYVRSDDSDGWIWEGDLPPEKVGAMYARIKREWQKFCDDNPDPPRVRSERAPEPVLIWPPEWPRGERT